METRAGLQALAGSSNISQLISRIQQSGNSTPLIDSLGRVCHSSDDRLVNKSILEAVLKDEELRNNFNITGDSEHSLGVIQQPADLLSHLCLNQMRNTKCIGDEDLCQYRSSMKCVHCENTHGHENDNVISVPPPESDVRSYILGFPYMTNMVGVDQVNCDTCGTNMNHTKCEKLQTSTSSTVVLCFNRHENAYKNLNVPEFLQMGNDGDVNRYHMVGATIHRTGHFVSLRKLNEVWYLCDDERIKKLSSNTLMRFHNSIYARDFLMVWCQNMELWLYMIKQIN